ncbi:DUF309 domain-containing protein [Pseudalkalibacillus sp. SCS-8]|uniref:DUF309 domain-containing protein n=1 Tax=Pseudalkalibacillus nanhaiensis TaxID=3115291 RepID=UPI0032DADA28
MYPKPYIDYLVHFHGLRDYFECHEILEEHWKSVPEDQAKKHWVGLIQIAVSLYHQRRKNYSGALRMMTSAANIIEKEQSEIEALGLDVDVLLLKLQERIVEIENQQPYESFNLPIKDKTLLARLEKECEEKNCTFGIPSDMDDDFLVNKHTLRDRQPVINERLEQKALRKKKREG